MRRYRKWRECLRRWLNAGEKKPLLNSSNGTVVGKPNHEVMEMVRQFVGEGRQTLLPVRGYSMRIFVEHERDKAILAPFDAATLKRGDVVLTWVTEGYYVLHRVVNVEGDDLTLMGDGNIRGKEHCKRSDVLAKAIGFVRKGRQNPDMVTYWKWRIYSVFWLGLLPIRRWLLLLWRLKQRILR